VTGRTAGEGGLGAAEREFLLSRIRDIPDWPQPGVTFKDITPLLLDHDAFAKVVSALAATGRDEDGVRRVDTVVGIEARGFILAAPVAHVLGAGFVPVRKVGKLPYRTRSASFALEYGEATIEVHRDAFRPGDKVLVVDDVLATGGTAAATCRLVEALGGAIIGVGILIELSALGGRATLGERRLETLMTY
jgi:adenine phosphoribosyltransferase